MFSVVRLSPTAREARKPTVKYWHPISQAICRLRTRYQHDFQLGQSYSCTIPDCSLGSETAMAYARYQSRPPLMWMSKASSIALSKRDPKSETLRLRHGDLDLCSKMVKRNEQNPFRALTYSPFFKSLAGHGSVNNTARYATLCDHCCLQFFKRGEMDAGIKNWRELVLLYLRLRIYRVSKFGVVILFVANEFNNTTRTRLMLTTFCCRADAQGDRGIWVWPPNYQPRQAVVHFAGAIACTGQNTVITELSPDDYPGGKMQ
jgi:hypothetical protein